MEGVSGAMARKLGLKNVEILVPEDGGIGLGVIGDLPSPMSSEEAVAFVKKAFSLKVARVSRPIDGKISRIAMCGGAGADMISDALAAGAQMYLSGDISYHNFFTPDGLMIMDIGHFESEIDITGILFSVIRKKFPNFAVRVSERMENPVRYC
jgi:putative NIF3 family GTP cyclohydrolase 1 type 2